jgi:CDP-glycerol glycerophosphotransferase
MITGYSSTMFVFAITGKPLLHDVPDYERFRDEVRGFYFDLAEQSPGPLARDIDELVAAIGAARTPDRRYLERYAAFRARYCSLEDGRATDRVVELVMRALSGDRPTAAVAGAAP